MIMFIIVVFRYFRTGNISIPEGFSRPIDMRIQLNMETAAASFLFLLITERYICIHEPEEHMKLRLLFHFVILTTISGPFPSHLGSQLLRILLHSRTKGGICCGVWTSVEAH